MLSTIDKVKVALGTWKGCGREQCKAGCPHHPQSGLSLNERCKAFCLRMVEHIAASIDAVQEQGDRGQHQ